MLSLSRDDLCRLYGEQYRLCAARQPGLTLVLSTQHPINVEELDQLWGDVGLGELPLWRVETALKNSLFVVGPWQHDHQSAVPTLVGFARCIGDGITEAVVCDVAIHPYYQGNGLGKQLMNYVLRFLRDQQVERVTLFADPEAVKFYLAQDWQLEPGGAPLRLLA